MRNSRLLIHIDEWWIRFFLSYFFTSSWVGGSSFTVEHHITSRQPARSLVRINSLLNSPLTRSCCQITSQFYTIDIIDWVYLSLTKKKRGKKEGRQALVILTRKKWDGRAREKNGNHLFQLDCFYLLNNRRRHTHTHKQLWNFIVCACLLRRFKQIDWGIRK